jgi:tryptophan synthase beta chain
VCNPVNFSHFPGRGSDFSRYSGRFVAETLIDALHELEAAWRTYHNDPEFLAELDADLAHYAGRPTPLYHAERWSRKLGGAQIYLKREDLNPTDAHKISNTIGQALLAKRMGKTRLIAETDTGQHGVASAMVAARLGMECVVYMSAENIQRQALNVCRMRLLGAIVQPVDSGSRTLKGTLNKALCDWVNNVDDTFYMIGTVAGGPHPYPLMVREFQAVIGREAREQMSTEYGCLPDALVVCVSGGSNAIGLFHPFLNDKEVAIYGVEVAGAGIKTGQHRATLCAGWPGVLRGNRTYLLNDDNSQILATHLVSTDLDYPGVGPEHTWLEDTSRVQYVAVTDEQALRGFHDLTRTEGIIPALENSHALAYVTQLASTLRPDQRIVVNLSGRGDKDIYTVAALKGMRLSGS